MPIAVRCPGCARPHQINDAQAGKNFLCSRCGTEFSVPQPAPPPPPPLPPSPVPRISTVPYKDVPSQTPSAIPAPVPVVEYRSRPKPVKKTRRIGKDPHELVDFWLPWGLIVLFYGPFFVLGVVTAFFGPIPPLSILYQIFTYALLIYVVLPIAEAGLRGGLHAMGVDLLEDGRLKIFAAWCPSSAILTVAVIVAVVTGAFTLRSGSWIKVLIAFLSSVSIGIAISFVVFFLLLWLLFHLRFLEAVIAFIFTSVFTMLGSMVAFVIMFVVSIPISWIVSAVGYAYNPIAAVAPRPPLPAAPAPPSGSSPFVMPRSRLVDPRDIAQRQYQPPPPYVPPVSQPPVTVPPVPPPLAFVPAPGSSIANPQPRPVPANIPPAPSPRRESEFVNQFRSAKSALIAQISAADFGDNTRNFIHTRTPSPFVAVVKDAANGLDQIEVWNVLSHQKRGETSLLREAAAESTVALSPDANSLARITRFPKLCIDVTYLKPGVPRLTIPLNERFGSPTLAGYLAPDKLAIRWKRGAEDGLEVWDLPNARATKQLPLMHTAAPPANGALSPDGRYFVLAVNPPRGVPQAQVYELLSTRGGARWSPLNVEATLAESPAAMSFSPDGKRFAILYSHNNRASLTCFTVTDGKLLKAHDFPVPVRSSLHTKPSTLVWISNSSALLAFGDLVLDPETGNIKTSLNPPDFTDHWAIDANTLAYRFESQSHCSLATVTLNPGPDTSTDAVPAKSRR